MKKQFLITFLFLIGGCKEGDVSLELSQLKNEMYSINNKISSLSDTLQSNKISENPDHELYRDIASSTRLASITSNFMNSQMLYSLDSNHKKIIKLISDEMKDDLYDEVMYNTIFLQGYAYTQKSTPSGFLQYDKWLINSMPGEYFGDGSLNRSIKLFFYESINKPICNEGSPKAIYKLIQKNTHDSEMPKFKVLESEKTYTIMPEGTPKLSQLREFRVLFEIRCE